VFIVEKILKKKTSPEKQNQFGSILSMILELMELIILLFVVLHVMLVRALNY
jgi:hypothetical protein